MNYYDISSDENGETIDTYAGTCKDEALRVMCFDQGSSMDEIDADDYTVHQIDVTDLDDAKRFEVRALHTAYKAAQVVVMVDDENNNDEWWDALSASMSAKLKGSGVVVLALDELSDLMALPGWYSEGNDHAPTPLTWRYVECD